MLYKYVCESCEYDVQSSSDIDFGMMAVVEPHTCLDCKIVTSVLIGSYGIMYNPHNDNLSLFSEEEIASFFKCEKCDGENIKPWSKYNRRCPKCNERMKEDKNGITVCWD